jgi:hypothetical protein
MSGSRTAAVVQRHGGLQTLSMLLDWRTAALEQASWILLYWPSGSNMALRL